MNSAVKQHPRQLPGLLGRWASLAALLLMALPASGQLKQTATKEINFVDATLDPINSVASKADPWGADTEIAVGETMDGKALSTNHRIQKVVVGLPNLTHSYLADLDVLLTGPGSKGVVLLSDVALNQSVGSVNLSIEDGKTPFPPGASPAVSSGSYAPTDYNVPPPVDDYLDANYTPPLGTALSAFKGMAARGSKWRLYALDDRFNDRGNMGRWELTLFIDPIVTISNKTDQEVTVDNTITIGRNPDGTPSMFEDTAYRIPVNINDPDTAHANITVSVVDISDTTIIPKDASASAGWSVERPTSGNDWTVVLKTAAHKFGNLTCRIKVDDGVNPVYFPLNVRIAPLNDAPVVDKVKAKNSDGNFVENYNLKANQGEISEEFELDLSDPDAGDVDSLTISGTSLNESALDHFAIIAAPVPPGTPRKFRLAPKGDYSGASADAKFNIIATDSSNSNSAPKQVNFEVVKRTDRFVRAKATEIDLPDAAASSTKSELTIADNDIGAKIAKITATLANFNHENPQDVSIMLTGPNGKSVVLMHNVGGTGGANILANNRITFDDAAALSIPDSGPIVAPAGDISGETYKPTLGSGTLPTGFVSDFTTLSGAFNNIDPKGKWTVTAIDRVTGKAGKIRGGFILTIWTRPTIAVAGNPEKLDFVEDGAGQAINVTFSDLDGKIKTMRIQEVVTGTALLDAAALELNETLASDKQASTFSRSKTVKPLANAAGTTKIRITAIDNLDYEQTLEIPVNIKGQNDGPTITEIQKQVAYQGQVITKLVVTARDTEKRANGNRLSLTRDSSDKKLLPNENIVFTSIEETDTADGTLRTWEVSLFPAAGERGVTQVTLTATDLGQTEDTTAAIPGPDSTKKSASTTFRLEVPEVPSQTVSATGPLAIDIIDAGLGKPGEVKEANPYPSVPNTARPPEGTTTSGTVSGLLKNTANVYVNLYGVTAIPEDVAVALVSPEKRAVLLMRDVGGNVRVSNRQLRFQDSGESIPSGALPSGVYKPLAQSGNLLGVFPNKTGVIDWATVTFFPTFKDAYEGRDPNGTWALYVIDDNGNGKENDQIGSWMLTIETKPELTLDANSYTADEEKGQTIGIDLGDPQPGVQYRVRVEELNTPPAGEILGIIKSFTVSDPISPPQLRDSDRRQITLKFNDNIPKVAASVTSTVRVTVERAVLGTGGTTVFLDPSSKDFTLKVNQLNDVPTITGLPETINIPAGTISPVINYTVGDVETGVNDLKSEISYKGSDITIVPVVTTGANRSFYVVPNGPNDAVATISVTVTDKGSARTTDGSDAQSKVVNIAYNATGNGKTVFSVSSPITINDQARANPYPVIISVPNLKQGLVGRANLTLHRYYHNFPDDVAVVLVSPTGEKSVIMANAGGVNPLHSIPRDKAVTLVFSPLNTLGLIPDVPDTAPATDALKTGSYRPAKWGGSVVFPDPGSNSDFPIVTGDIAADLGVFANKFIAGDWKLYIYDDTFTDSGAIEGGVSIAFEMAPFLSIAGGYTQDAVEDVTKNIAFEIQDGDTTDPTKIVVTPTILSGSDIVKTLKVLPADNKSFSRTLEIVPNENKNGEVKIRLAVTDGTFANNNDITVKFAAVDDAPVLKLVGSVKDKDRPYDYQINEDSGLFAINVEISDVDSEVKLEETTTLSTTASIIANNADSIKTNSVPNPIPANTTGTMTLQVKPAANANGTANVELTVRDKSNATRTNILVRVKSLNDNPEFANVGDDLTFANKKQVKVGTTGTLRFSVKDVETDAKAILVDPTKITSSNADAIPPSTFAVSRNNDQVEVTFRAAGVVDALGVEIKVTIDDLNSVTAKDEGDSGVVTRTFIVDVEGLAADPSNAFAKLGAFKIPGTGESGKAATYPSVLDTRPIKDLKGNIWDVALVLDGVKHGALDDLDVLLVSPDGTGLVVMSDAGGSQPSDVLPAQFPNLRLEFSDAADAAPMRDDGPVTSGKYQVANFGAGGDADVWPDLTGVTISSARNFAEAFRGKKPNGDWKLYIIDDAGGARSVGELTQGWTLKITTTPVIFVGGSTIENDSQEFDEDNNPTASKTYAGFRVADPDAGTDPVKLELTPASDHPSIIDTKGMVVTGNPKSVAGGSFQIVPVANAFANDDKNPAVVRWVAKRPSDGATWTFQIKNKINPKNDDPINSRLADREIFEGETHVIRRDEFAITDYDNDQVSIVVTSRDQSIVKDSDIKIITGTGVLSGNSMDPVVPTIGWQINHVAGITDGNVTRTVIIRVTTKDKSDPAKIANQSIPNPKDENTLQDTSPNREDVDEYVLKIKPRNDPPVITPQESGKPVLATAGKATSFEITVTDPDTAATDLVGSVTSGDPNKVKAATVTRKSVSGNTSKWDVSFTPEVASKGDVSLTVRIEDKNDKSLADSEGFAVLISPSRERRYVPVSGQIPVVINDYTSEPGKSSPYPSIIDTRHLKGDIAEISVEVNGLTHKYPDDIDMILVGPNNKAVYLMSDAGGSSPLDHAFLTFVTDTGKDQVYDSQRLESGASYRTKNHEGADTIPAGSDFTIAPTDDSLASFVGTKAGGLWKLYVLDDTRQDSGSISNWAVRLTTKASLQIVGSTSREIKEDGDIDLDFTITDEDEFVDAQTFDFSYGSTNAVLVKPGKQGDAGVTLVSTSKGGELYNLVGKPTADASGETEITITATSKAYPAYPASAKFQLKVTTVNDAPKFSRKISPVLTIESGWATEEQDFTYGDAESPQTALRFEVISDRPSLLPKENVYFVGSSLYFVPVGTEVGTANITIRVLDPDADALAQGRYDEQQIQVNVVPALSQQYAGGSIRINDPAASSPYPSEVSVPAQKGKISKVTVSLSKLTHRYPADVDVVIVHPGGKAVRLMSDVGGNQSLSEAWFNFADDGVRGVMPANPSSSLPGGPRSWKPSNFDNTETAAAFGATSLEDSLSAFNGLSAEGVWKLYVDDDASPDGGDLEGWVLNIHTDEPSIGTIAPLTFVENGPDQEVTFKVSDGNNTPAQLTWKATVDRSSLISVTPATGTGASPKFVVRPQPYANGDTFVTVDLTDGVTTVSSRFNVTVTPVNFAPTITGLTDTSTAANRTKVLDFTVGDPDFELAAELTAGAVTGNSALAKASVTGTGGSRKLVIEPLGQVGETDVTVTVSDGVNQTVKKIIVTIGSAYVLQVAPIADQVVSEDGTVSVPVVVSGSESGTITLAAANYDTNLVKEVVFSTTAGTTTARIVLVANANGATPITIVADDTLGQGTTTFDLVITPVNDAPTIGAISDQTTTANVPVTLTLDVDDIDTDPTNFVYSSSLSNDLIVSAVTFDTSGDKPTAKVELKPGATGAVSVTIKVSDGELTGEETFALTVNPAANIPPVLGLIPPQQTRPNVQAIVPLQVSDADTAASALVFSSENNNPALVRNVVFGLSSAGNFTANVNLVRDASGTANVTVFVFDGATKVSQTFVLTVVENPPTLGPIADQLTVANKSVDVNLDVQDIDTPINELSFSATSSNPSLIAGVTFDTTGGVVKATINPVKDATGVATVTISVKDTVNIASRTFAVGVNAAQPPKFEAPGITTNPDGSKSITITWSNGGELEYADSAVGPWTATGNTSGSFTEPVGTGSRVYRIRR